jgi:hypothetical protein
MISNNDKLNKLRILDNTNESYEFNIVLICLGSMIFILMIVIFIIYCYIKAIKKKKLSETRKKIDSILSNKPIKQELAKDIDSVRSDAEIKKYEFDNKDGSNLGNGFININNNSIKSETKPSMDKSEINSGLKLCESNTTIIINKKLELNLSESRSEAGNSLYNIDINNIKEEKEMYKKDEEEAKVREIELDKEFEEKVLKKHSNTDARSSFRQSRIHIYEFNKDSKSEKFNKDKKVFKIDKTALSTDYSVQIKDLPEVFQETLN